MTAFRDGKIQVLTNCALFDEGLDIPGLDGVILARPTASLGRYLQMVGRALRISKGKEIAIIIDLAGNYQRLGLPCDDRIWSLEGVESVKRLESKRLHRKSDGQIEEITIDLTQSNIQLQEISRLMIGERSDLDEWEDKFNRLCFTQQLNRYQPGWIVYRLAELKPPLAIWFKAACYLGYKPGWAHYRWQECQEVTT